MRPTSRERVEWMNAAPKQQIDSLPKLIDRIHWRANMVAIEALSAGGLIWLGNRANPTETIGASLGVLIGYSLMKHHVIKYIGKF